MKRTAYFLLTLALIASLCPPAAAWSGHDVTEESLYETYGKVVTSTGQAFCDEMNRQFPEHVTIMHKYLKDTELLERVYDSLSQGIPVPFEWAALYEDTWTLHYSLITGMDLPQDTITVANPYGYYENLTVREFLDRTRFDAFENMPLFLKLAFAFGIFEKNTVFIPSPLSGTSVPNTSVQATQTYRETGFYGEDLCINVKGNTMLYEREGPGSGSLTPGTVLDGFYTTPSQSMPESIAWEVYYVKEYPDLSYVLVISGTNSVWTYRLKR